MYCTLTAELGSLPIKQSKGYRWRKGRRYRSTSLLLNVLPWYSLLTKGGRSAHVCKHSSIAPRHGAALTARLATWFLNRSQSPSTRAWFQRISVSLDKGAMLVRASSRKPLDIGFKHEHFMIVLTTDASCTCNLLSPNFRPVNQPTRSARRVEGVTVKMWTDAD